VLLIINDLNANGPHDVPSTGDAGGEGVPLGGFAGKMPDLEMLIDEIAGDVGSNKLS
jgi:hypothetical protein